MQSILKNGLIWIIKFYRKYISPMKTTKCLYYPTCSTYGLHAVEKYGFLKAELWLPGVFFVAIHFQKVVTILFHKMEVFNIDRVIFNCL